jgi:AcrR family transcriptional regulator
MSYEVVNRIRGHQYRYQVTSFRDPVTGKVRQTWSYVGPVAARGARGEREAEKSVRQIIQAILKLLDKRDVSHISIGVIARAAGVSRSTFYRRFPNKNAALTVAFETALGESRKTREYSLITEPIQSAAFERKRLGEWIEAILRNSVRSPGVQRAMSSSRELHALRQRNSRENHAEVHGSLVVYLRRLRAAGLIDAGSAEALADGIQCVISGIFKRTVYDHELSNEPALLAAGIELVCRALFGRQTGTTARGGIRRIAAHDSGSVESVAGA